MNTNDAATTNLIACRECDLLHTQVALPAGARASCRRCGAALYQDVPDSLNRALALHLAALMLLVMANAFPFMALRLSGRVQENVLASGALALFEHGFWELSLLVFCTSILFPLLTIAGMLYVLLPLRLGWRPPAYALLYRLVRVLTPWSLVGVFMLGALVAIVKLLELADIIPGIALFSLAGLLLVSTAAAASTDPRILWPAAPAGTPAARPAATAAASGLVGCDTCDLLVPAFTAQAGMRCPRCGGGLHSRKRDSVVRTWALVASAALLLIPANLYPVMTVTRFGRGEPNTIFSGVVQLIEEGMWGLALLVFFASIVVPIVKLGVLTLLLTGVHRGSEWRPRDRVQLFRFTEVVGAWSMVDVFLVGILSALVKMDALATVTPGLGASFFAAVVVLTLFAAHSFDPRLIWDSIPADD